MEHKLIRKDVEGKIIFGGGFDCGMPIGNGRLGAMVTGDVMAESISLNQDSLWSVRRNKKRNNPAARKHLDLIRQLLREGKMQEADKYCYLAMTSLPKYMGAYEPMCNVWTGYNHNDRISGYKRELDMQNGVAGVDYVAGDLKVHREYFVSYEYQVMAVKIEADRPELDMQLNLMRRPYENEATEFIGNNSVHIKGCAGSKGVKFDCVLSAKTDGKMETIGDYLHFSDASQIILYITAETDFYEKKPLKKCLEHLKKAMAEDYDRIKEKHIADFSSLYNRTSIDFGTKSEETVAARLETLRSGGADKSIFELFFNYGKYLTISASRPGSQAMNLQGIWNAKYAAEWDCNYTINVNTQMNYWIAETAQLSECHEPLFALIERMVPNGERVAKEVYGCDGFVAHHTTNLWGDASINGNAFPSSIWPMGGAWLIKHMWDHYLYTGDKEFLAKRAFPIMKKAALFFTQYMTEAEDGYFESGPSLSPENLYFTADGTKGRHCMAPEMDNQIIRSLFRSLVKTYEILGYYDKDYEKYKEFMGKIRPTRINKNGGIMEWDKDYTEYDPGHRHISPLFAVHPDYEITPSKTPELAQACIETINRRLGGSEIEFSQGFCHWNGAWLSGVYSKLKRGEDAINALYTIIRNPGSVSEGLLTKAPVFQIECNFGIAAAIVEMLLYSDEESIELLPALPEELKDGSLKGLVTRGAFVVDLEWKEGKATKASITSRSGNECRIKAVGLSGVDTEYTVDGEYIVFKTEPGKVYGLSFE